MMMICNLLAGSAAILLLAAGAPVLQDTPQPEKKVCKGVRTVGTLMEKRICLTPAEWKQFAARTRGDVDTLRNQGAVGKTPSRGGN